MARTKPTNSIITRDQAEDAMRRLDEIDRQFAEWDMDEANAVSKVREEFNEARKAGGYVGLEAQRKLLVKELEAWAETDHGNWKGKTLPMKAGKLGFRVAAPSVVLFKKVAKSFVEAIDQMKLYLGKGSESYIRTKEELDKEAILAAWKAKELDEHTLADMGLKIKNDDEFWLETAASKDLEEAMKRLKAA